MRRRAEVSRAFTHSTQALTLGLVVLAVTSPAIAQRYQVLPGPNDPRRKTSPIKPESAADSNTIVNVELYADLDGVGYQAQLWRPVFEKLGFDVQIRTGQISDKPDVVEESIGKYRRVKAIGYLDRQGRITFPERTYSRDQADNLQKYLEELQKFGKQGNPAGQPLWGLNEEQFGEIYKVLSQQNELATQGKSLAKAIDDLAIPKTYPVRFTPEADRWLAAKFPKQPAFRQELKGYGKGTVLAMLLTEYGLGFKPTRTPAGSLEITVEPLTSAKVWPVGWELKDSRTKTAPAFFQFVPVDLESIALQDVLTAVSVKAKLPLYFDYYRIEAKHIDLSKLIVDYPPRKTSMHLMLKGVTMPHGLKHELKIDELGQPFLWLTTLKPVE